MDWFDLLAVQGTLKSLLWHHSSKASILQCSAFFMVQLSRPYMTTGKPPVLLPGKFHGQRSLVSMGTKNWVWLKRQHAQDLSSLEKMPLKGFSNSYKDHRWNFFFKEEVSFLYFHTLILFPQEDLPRPKWPRLPKKLTPFLYCLKRNVLGQQIGDSINRKAVCLVIWWRWFM